MTTLARTSRRDFLRATSAFAVTTGLLGLTQPAPGAEATKWPVACRDAHIRSTGQPDCWSALKYLGATGVEVEAVASLDCPQLYGDKKYRIATDDDLRMLQDDLDANGLKITAFLMHNRLTERLEEELQWAKNLVKAAQRLKINAIRIDVTPGSMAKDQFLPFAIKACKQLCDLVEGTPIRYGIENHGNVTNDPAFLDKLFDGVGSSHLGLTLDAANFYWYGHPLDNLYALYQKYASRTVHTHCKNIGYPADKKDSQRPVGWEYEKYTCPLFLGDIDYAKVAEILRAANYQGDFCLENECLGHVPKDQQPIILKMEIQWLKKVSA